jgi:hypothetical protein
MGKNRNKNKHRRGGGKFMHDIEKQTDLYSELNAEYYDSRSLVKIEKNIGYGYFNVIVVNNSMKKKAYCRYMFTHRSPGYAIAEGKDDLQMVAPVSDSCAGQYISKNRFESNIAAAEGKSDEASASVSFYTEEELAGLDAEKREPSRREVTVEERKLHLKAVEKEEKESVHTMLQVLIPKLERQLEKAVGSSSRCSKEESLTECMKIIDQLKSGCTRSEAKEYYSSFKVSIKTV